MFKLRHGSVILDKIINHDCVQEFLNDADPISRKSYVIIVQKEKCDVDKSPDCQTQFLFLKTKICIMTSKALLLIKMDNVKQMQKLH